MRNVWGSITSRVRRSGKIFSIPFEAIETFGTVTKVFEETEEISKAAKYLFTLAQFVAKAFSCILRVQSFPGAATRECKRKVAIDKPWDNFKPHFSREISDY